MKTLSAAFVMLATLVLSPTAISGDYAKQKDIIDTAVGAGSFQILVTAIKEAGLVDTLRGDGPFTVFAPTDEAFARIPETDLKALLADRAALIRVLTYHVVAGRVLASDVLRLDSVMTLEGSVIKIAAADGVTVDNARVVNPDILTSNGVIHVIDSVIMPTM